MVFIPVWQQRHYNLNDTPLMDVDSYEELKTHIDEYKKLNPESKVCYPPRTKEQLEYSIEVKKYIIDLVCDRNDALDSIISIINNIPLNDVLFILDYIEAMLFRLYRAMPKVKEVCDIRLAQVVIRMCKLGFFELCHLVDDAMSRPDVSDSDDDLDEG